MFNGICLSTTQDQENLILFPTALASFRISQLSVFVSLVFMGNSLEMPPVATKTIHLPQPNPRGYVVFAYLFSAGNRIDSWG